MKIIYAIIIVLIPFLVVANTPDTINITSYNILNYPGSTGTARDPLFKTIIDSLQPDILVVEEVNNFTGAKRLLDSVMLKSNADYALGTVINNTIAPGEAENAIFYKKSKFTFVSNTPIYTTLRDINEFKLVHKASAIPFSVFGVHLKAGSAASDIAQRTAEVDSLRKVTNAKSFGSNFVVCGDFNTYNNTETDYVRILTDNVINDGELYDPINITGTWNNPIYARYHTQATRVFAEADGGSTSGLDDRFDLILYSDAVRNTGDMDYIAGSEIPYGNDGNHFNDSIDAGVNTSVASNVAYALHHASDHLPVTAKFRFFNQLLPVELISFNGEKVNNVNELTWQTSNEINNAGFEIERSTDAVSWQNIAYVSNIGFNKSQVSSYSYNDSFINNNISYYYRLKQIDIDNHFNYSAIVFIHAAQKTEISIYPNPTKNIFTIYSSNNLDANAEIYDISGRILFNTKLNSNQNIIDISQLDAGVYILIIPYSTPIKLIKE